MISEAAEAKFGQLQSADLAGYEASVRVLLGQIMAVSTLPAHYVGVFTDIDSVQLVRVRMVLPVRRWW